MGTLNLIRLPILTDQLTRWAGERGWLHKGSRQTFDEGRALHHLLNEMFGPGALRPFRLLLPPRCTRGNLYAYSATCGTALCEAALAYSTPDHLGVVKIDQLESKVMPTDWRPGQRLGFDLRTRPTRRLSSDLDAHLGKSIKKGSEVDAFLLDALRNRPDGQHPDGPTREAVYLDWLTDRLGPGVTLDRSTSRLVRFRRNHVMRGGRGLEGPDATFHGTFTVSEPNAIANLLSDGVGRHRSYGYGMLLLRPPNMPVPGR